MPKPTVPPAPPASLVQVGQSLQRGVVQLGRRMSPPQFALLDIITGAWRAHALTALARTGLASALDAGPQTAAELAAARALHAGAVFRVLRALASDGLLHRDGDRFSHTPISACASPDHPHSLFHTLRDFGGELRLQMWARLDHSLRTGEPSWNTMDRGDFWSHLEAHPDQGADFDGAMAEFSREGLGPHVRAYPWGQHDSVVDLGGGTGTLLAAILSLHPQLRGVLFDRPGALAHAPRVLADWEVSERAEVVSGDLTVGADLPAGHGVYVARHILHMHSDEDARTLLQAWRSAMAEQSRLVLIEVVVPENGSYLQFLDMIMLAGAGGKERTLDEFAQLLDGAGFVLERSIRTAAPLDLIVAAPRT